jgi:hypothetical protein
MLDDTLFKGVGYIQAGESKELRGIENFAKGRVRQVKLIKVDEHVGVRESHTRTFPFMHDGRPR